MHKFFMAMAMCGSVLASPVQAQSIFDTFRDLKGTVETLAGKRSDKEAEPTRARYDVAQFRVAGIGLGMSPDQVERIMSEAGFSISRIKEVYSFSDHVRIEAERLRQPSPLAHAEKLVSTIFGEDGQGNHLSVDFVSLQDGARVKSVSLTFNENTADVASLRADVLDNYGQPSFDDKHTFNTLRWCSRDEVRCAETGSIAPQLSFSQYIGRHTLQLSNKNAMESERKRQIASFFSGPSTARQRSLLGGS